MNTKLENRILLSSGVKKSCICFATIMLFIMIIAFGVCANVYAADVSDLVGEGTESAPYEIETEEDLLTVVEGVNDGSISDKYFVLTSDIDITEEQIIPIGLATQHFTGSFDGQNHRL